MHYQKREAEIYDRAYAHLKDDIPYWQSLAREHTGEDGEALELACGTLRITLPVAEAGVRVTGIDESRYMLQLARQKLDNAAPEVRERVTLVQGDMRSFDFGRTFNFIYLPFNTFGILTTIDNQLALLETVRKHLAPGSCFAFSVFVPDPERLSNTNAYRWLLENDNSFPDGTRVQRDIARSVDIRRQILSITWRNREYKDQVLLDEWITDLQLSFFFPRELEHLLVRAGYEMVHYWGDYNRTDFWSMSAPWQQLIVARPRG